MKKLVIPALLMSSAVMANVADLNYQPAAGKFHLSALGEYTSAEFDSTYKEDGSADVKSEYELTTNTLSAGLSYGVMDNLALGLSFGYDLVADTEVNSKVSSKENGLKDPSLTLAYRALNSDGLMFDLNLGLDMAFDDKEDNATRGGHTVKVGADVSKKWGNLELMGEVAASYLMESKSKDADMKSTNDPSYDLELTVAAQYAVSNEFYLMARAGYAQIGEADSKTTTDSGSYKATTEAIGQMAVGIGAKFAVNADMAFKIGHDYNMTSDYKIKYEDGSREEVKDTSAHTTYIGMDMAF